MIVRREILNDGRVWLEVPVIVVVDEPELFATYIAEDQIAATRAEGKADC